MSALRTALVVLVPEAEPAVGRHRARCDSSAALGVPAHVTVLFPFVAVDGADEALETLRPLFQQHPTFEARFERTAWFGDEVVYVEPSDPAPFTALTEAVHAAFPEHPPYEGAHETVVAHLTIGDRHGADLPAAEREVAPLLPFATTARAVSMLAEQPDGTWLVHATLPLRRPSVSPADPTTT